jgi:hypothetical protein
LRRAATARKTGQGCERRTDTAAMADEIVKCARSDIVAADETKPVEPVLVVQSRLIVQMVTRLD